MAGETISNLDSVIVDVPLKQHLKGLLAQTKERHEAVHLDLTQMIERLAEYHTLDVQIVKEITELETLLDEYYAGWRDGN